MLNKIEKIIILNVLFIIQAFIFKKKFFSYIAWEKENNFMSKCEDNGLRTERIC